MVGVIENIFLLHIGNSLLGWQIYFFKVCFNNFQLFVLLYISCCKFFIITVLWCIYFCLESVSTNLTKYNFFSGTGTFGRVLLCKNKSSNEYGAMKILCLSDVIRLKQVEHVKNEKNILQEIRHPFIVNM